MANKARRERMTPDNIFNPDITNLVENLKERGKKDRRSRTKAATVCREAKGGLDPKGPAQVTDISSFRGGGPAESTLRKVIGGNDYKERELTQEEIEAVFAKYPGDSFAAIKELEKMKKG